MFKEKDIASRPKAVDALKNAGFQETLFGPGNAAYGALTTD